jgi:hypothetical protein
MNHVCDVVILVDVDVELKPLAGKCERFCIRDSVITKSN